jgi:hypothetical protein
MLEWLSDQRILSMKICGNRLSFFSAHAGVPIGLPPAAW